MTTYGITKSLAQSFDEVVPAVKEALKAQGFGVLTEIDVQATMKAKLDEDIAPYLIARFEKTHSHLDDGRRVKNYYVGQSTGIACGMLITALHHAGLATLTHTPSPMSFLNKILGRPKEERPFLLLVVGYPVDGVKVPDIKRKPLDKIATFL